MKSTLEIDPAGTVALRLPAPAVMYDALVQRDASFDGVFVAAIRTTGIFCRPTCPARKPLAKNVEYFARSSDALHAGYRPCRRCRPLDPPGGPEPWVQELLAVVDADPARRLMDADLQARGFAPDRVRRWFQRHYGMTFQAYHRARRLGGALGEIRDGGAVERAGLAGGFASTSGFRTAFTQLFGTPPAGARTKDLYAARWLDSPLGALLAVAGDNGLVLLEFVDRRALAAQITTLRRRTGRVIVPGAHRYLAQTKKELAEYFAGARRTFEVPIDTPGSDFQRAVWGELLAIPYGETRSYAALADAVGRPGAHRAVGTANGFNRIAVIVPCHRVVRTDGTLAGYGGGVWRKQRLLELERG